VLNLKKKKRRRKKRLKDEYTTIKSFLSLEM
jgi:hypothetical protein